MTRRYQIIDRPDRCTALDPAKLAALLAKDGQLLLPLLDLVIRCQFVFSRNPVSVHLFGQE
jgi:hypothetical protein